MERKCVEEKRKGSREEKRDFVEEEFWRGQRGWMEKRV